MSQNCAFVETWAGLLAQAIGQQDFGSNDLETKASSRTRQQFHYVEYSHRSLKALQ